MIQNTETDLSSRGTDVRGVSHGGIALRRLCCAGRWSTRHDRSHGISEGAAARCRLYAEDSAFATAVSKSEYSGRMLLKIRGLI